VSTSECTPSLSIAELPEKAAAMNFAAAMARLPSGAAITTLLDDAALRPVRLTMGDPWHRRTPTMRAAPSMPRGCRVSRARPRAPAGASSRRRVAACGRWRGVTMMTTRGAPSRAPDAEDMPCRRR
jgi:hypothetical protein